MNKARKELEKAYDVLKTKRAASRNVHEQRRIDASLFLVILALDEPSNYDYHKKNEGDLQCVKHEKSLKRLIKTNSVDG